MLFSSNKLLVIICLPILYASVIDLVLTSGTNEITDSSINCVVILFDEPGFVLTKYFFVNINSPPYMV